MGFWAAVPTILNVASSLFGKKKGGGETVTQQPMMTPNQQLLSEWLSKYLPSYAPGEQYTGKLSAGATPFETQGLDILGKYLQAPTYGETGLAGKQQLLDTLSGKFMTPETSPFIQAMQRMSQRNLEDAISKSRLGQGARGKFYSTAGLEEEGRLTGATQDFLNTLIGQFIQGERGRMFEAVPQAMQLDEYEQALAPLKKVGATQTFGALSRTLEQGDLERQYEEWKRARSEKGKVPELAAGAGAQWGIPSWTSPTTTQNNSLGNIISILQGLNWGNMGKQGGTIWDIFKSA